MIPHFNRVELLKETLHSIQAQNYSAWEVIVVDDGSTDEQWGALQNLGSERIRILRRLDGYKGPSRCRNLGAAAAAGDFLVFVDSDDLLAPWCLERRINEVVQHLDADFWVFQVMLFKHNPGDIDLGWNRLEGENDLDRFLRPDPPWHTTSPIWRRRAFLDIGGFNEKVFGWDDADLHIKALLHGLPYCKFTQLLPDAFIRRSDTERMSNSGSQLTLDQRLDRLTEGFRLLRTFNAATEKTALWEGRYFIEAEAVLFTESRPKTLVLGIIERWEVDYQPSLLLKSFVRIYFRAGLLCRDRAYLLLRIARRLAMLVLPRTFFPRGGEFHQWKFSHMQRNELVRRLGKQSDAQFSASNRTGHGSSVGKKKIHKPWWNTQLHAVRAVALQAINRWNSRRFEFARDPNNVLPVFLIASRPDFHLAPLALETQNRRVQSIVVANGVYGRQLDWLRRECGSVPVLPLRASFKDHSENYLSHAEVIAVIDSLCRTDFCIQDADCFVTDSKWWDSIVEGSETAYAIGPFGKPLNDLPEMIPDTYLVRINKRSFTEVSQQYGVDAAICETPSVPVRRALDDFGIGENWFPDDVKQYFDTLQLYWTAATLSGLKFHLIPGAEREVIHVGGSSYLTTADIEDPSHWDWWAVNTIYFHLRVLEAPRFDDVRDCFSSFFQRFGSSNEMLSKYPDYLESDRHNSCIRLLEHLKNQLSGSRGQQGEMQVERFLDECCKK